MFLGSCVRTLHQTLGPEKFILCYLLPHLYRSVFFTFKSMIHFKLIFPWGLGSFFIGGWVRLWISNWSSTACLKIILYPLNCFCTLVKNQLVVVVGAIAGFFILSHWSKWLSLLQTSHGLHDYSYIISLESGRMIPLTLFFLKIFNLTFPHNV